MTPDEFIEALHARGATGDCAVVTPAPALISGALSRCETAHASRGADSSGRGFGDTRAARRDGSVICARGAASLSMRSRSTPTMCGERTPNSTGRHRRNLEHSPDRDARPAVRSWRYSPRVPKSRSGPRGTTRASSQGDMAGWVAEEKGEVTGFIVARRVASDLGNS